MLALLLIAACAPARDSGKQEASTGDSAAAPAIRDTPMAGMPGMGGMKMTGDPDRDFLRMMSDHHKGLIAMVHESMENRGSPAMRADARKLDTRQDDDMKKMLGMLDNDYKDPYEPQVTPDNQAMLDSLLKQPDKAAYDHAFYTSVVAHHRQALTMIDAYLPKARRADLKAMAETMKADQAREIAEFERKAGGG